MLQLQVVINIDSIVGDLPCTWNAYVALAEENAFANKLNHGIRSWRNIHMSCCTDQMHVIHTRAKETLLDLLPCQSIASLNLQPPSRHAAAYTTPTTTII